MVRNKNLLSGLSILLLALSACGERGGPTAGFTITGDGIINGKSIPKRDGLRKSVVALVAQRAEGQALCTGSIIDDETILTAAHCVDGDPSQLVVVFSAAVKTAKQDQMRAADRFVQNPKWKKNTKKGRGDLALIHFTGGVPKGYQPVTLAGKETDVANGTEVLMIGYGVSNGSDRTGSGLLRETQTQIVGSVSKTEIVTDGHRGSVCFGDSGGPAFVERDGAYVQWGVASSVLNETCNEASVHTSVMGYEKWITSQTKKLKKSPKK